MHSCQNGHRFLNPVSVNQIRTRSWLSFNLFKKKVLIGCRYLIRIPDSAAVTLALFLLIFLSSVQCTSPSKKRETTEFDSMASAVESLMKTNADSAELLSWKLYQRAVVANDPMMLFDAARLRGEAFENAMKNDSVIIYYRIMLKVSEKSVDTLRLMKICSSLGSHYVSTSPIDSAAFWYRKGLELAITSNDSNFKALFSTNMGLYFIQTGKSDSAIICYTAAANYYEKAGDSVSLAQVYLSLGKVLFDQGFSEKAISYFKQAEMIHREKGDMPGLGADLTNLAVIYMTKKSDSANYYYQEAMKIVQKHGSPVNLLPVKFNYANYLCANGTNSEAEKIYREVLQISTKNNIPQGRIYSLAALGRLAAIKKEGHEANRLYRESIREAKSDHLTNDLVQLFRQAFEGNIELRNPDTALYYLNLWENLKDSLQTAAQKEAVMKYQTLYETKKLEAKLTGLSLDISRQKSRVINITLILALIILLLTSVLIYFIMGRRHIIEQRSIAELKSQQAEQESRLNKLEIEKLYLDRKVSEDAMEKLHLEIQLKQQELIFQSMQRIDLIQVNRSVEEKLSGFQYKITKKKDREDFIQSLHNITRDTGKDPMADFEEMFIHLHNSFYTNLLSRCPELTRTELQVCALIRLNLSSKEISRLIGLSNTTINITRYRIRKKLNLDAKDSLTAYMITC